MRTVGLYELTVIKNDLELISRRVCVTTEACVGGTESRTYL